LLFSVFWCFCLEFVTLQSFDFGDMAKTQSGVDMKFEYGNPFCLKKGDGVPTFLRCTGVSGSLSLKCAEGNVDKIKVMLKGEINR